MIHYQQGQWEEALELFQNVSDTGNADAVLLLAMAMKKVDNVTGAITELAKHEKAYREEKGKPCPFTCVLLGNMFHEKAISASRLRRQCKGTGDNAAAQRHGVQESKYLDQALKQYMRALEVDKTLWNAIRGVGVIVAHKGSTDIAQALLHKVKKYMSNAAAKIAVHLDLGHLSMDRALEVKSDLPQKPQIQQAIGFYRVAHRSDPTNPDVAMYYASALFHGAVAFNDVLLFKNCQVILNDAMLLDPNNTRIRFNSATCLMRMAYHFLRDQQKMQIEDHVNQAVGMLRSAHRIFQYLMDGPQERQTDVRYYIPTKMGDNTKLAENAEYCKRAVLQCENFLAKLTETRISRDAKNAELTKQKDAEMYFTF